MPSNTNGESVGSESIGGGSNGGSYEYNVNGGGSYEYNVVRLVVPKLVNYVRDYTPRVVSDTVQRAVQKFDDTLRAGLGLVAGKIDDFAKAIAQGANTCDDPLDSDVRRVEIERSRLRLLNALKRSAPGVLSELAGMGKTLGSAAPTNGEQARQRWEQVIAPYASDMGMLRSSASSSNT